VNPSASIMALDDTQIEVRTTTTSSGHIKSINTSSPNQTSQQIPTTRFRCHSEVNQIGQFHPIEPANGRRASDGDVEVKRR
jgi:hypothetical protein